MTIQLSNVRFAYPETPEKWIIDIPSWSVAHQQHLFLHGPSGSGKSTLLNILSGMLPVSQGEISVHQQRLDLMTTRQRDKFRAQHIGYVFQQFNLIPYLDALDNIKLTGQFAKGAQHSATEQEIHTLLLALNITHSDWKRPTAQLSIGQQQRVAIARALINKPALLIADEPTSSLDQANRDNFLSLLLPLVSSQNTTLLFVSHDLSLAKYFNRVEALSDINRVPEVSRCL